MKLSILTLTTVLAMSGVGEAQKWSCDRSGKGQPSTQKMKDAAWDFDRLFGKDRLTAASGQCYISHCRSHWFAFCNMAGVARKERKGDREKAKNTGLPKGQGNQCAITMGSLADPFNIYYFGTIDTLQKDGCFKKGGKGCRVDIRKC
ncbi:hypothetical protein FLONG3_6746 [Fusarium longipes]|uniref:Secreted protein n=1 Tax=Fusarium longipes TaxID=694270 RepID=A0A395SIU3_9HYPO|nr:hypothetical protein FLONG3_6746 [Fusarium longipes]